VRSEEEEEDGCGLRVREPYVRFMVDISLAIGVLGEDA